MLYGKVVFMLFFVKVSKVDDDMFIVLIMLLMLIKVEFFGFVEGVVVF